MKSMEDRLKQVDIPDISISSHRALLKERLANEPPRRIRAPYKRTLIVVALMVVVTISGISAIRPQWTQGIFSALLLNEKVTLNEDGSKSVTRTYQCNVSDCDISIPDTGVTMTDVTLAGDTIQYRVIAQGIDPRSDPKLMRKLAEDNISIDNANEYNAATIDITENGVTRRGTMFMFKQGCGGDNAVEQAINPFAEVKQMGAGTNAQAVPSGFTLEQNYPNPFNPETTINYSLKSASEVSLKVYSIDGKEVATLASGYHSTGSYSVKFNGKDLPSGPYICRLTAGNYTDTKNMMLMK